ncbi:TetR/AcrR family transcriptional regulator [Grimontia kaedaensis]|uniref:TetR/AcrR family transcriptional regulator n=1 Tax=Grimontia kaedaensis TaxID=2872157 RepID=A0ABY4WX75_9GAMM|nr:TetR/AcrR family transcriptional regulator [Grimontia kaedaensis]USH03579.1 TetR/AcrR family transcriptional regulator [Grimontia kaedaensis]
MTQEKTKAARGRPKTINRERILDVAMKAYWQEGTRGVSINEICKLAEVSKPGLYREFGNEDGLMQAALAAYIEQTFSPLITKLKSQTSLSGVLAELVEFVCNEREELPDGCLMVKMRDTQTKLGDKTQNALVEIHHQFMFFIEGWAQRAREGGEIPETMSNQFVADYIDAQLTAALAQRARGEDAEKVRTVLKMAFSVLSRLA